MRILAWEEDHAGGVTPRFGQLHARDSPQKLIRKLKQDSRSVPGIDLRTGRTPMLEPIEHVEGPYDGRVPRLAREVGDCADTTGVVLESRVVEADGLRSLCEWHKSS
jgi:hypothetical protein